MKISEAYEAPSEMTALNSAAGRTAADFILVYPPDSPLIIPGEVFTEEKIREIRGALKAGLTVNGLSNGEVRVLQ